MRALILSVFLLVSLVVLINAQNLTVTVYSGKDGKLQGTFQNWSWATVNLLDKTVVREGSTYSASVVIEGYKAAYFHGDFYMPIQNLTKLSFWINGGANGGQDVILKPTSGGNAVGSGVTVASILGGPIPANKWVQVTLDFSVFQSTQNVMLDGIQFQANTATNQGSIYLDDIQFVVTFPAPEPVTLKVQSTGALRVSPYIYGTNFATADQIKAIKYPVNRWGGNAVTRYSYDVDASNHASDWYFEDISNDVSDVSQLPLGSQSYVFVNDTVSNGAKVLLTTPTIGWRPFDRQKRCGFSVAKYGPQQSTDPYTADCGNGIKPDGTPITGNDPRDTSIETDPSYNVEWIKFLDKAFGTGTVRWFQMDNEPGLWHLTHRDVHPAPLTYDELWNRTLLYGGALKKAFPDSLIFGPISWGWCAYLFSAADGCSTGADRKAHGDVPLIQWYMQQVTNYQKANNIQIVDVIDVHFYPQAPGVFSTAEDPLTALLRLRSPRSLWDKTYASESWISQPIYILQRINDWIDTINPGAFKIAVSEFTFGDDTLITSALAQVEALGIFARQKVFIANRWVTPLTGSKVEEAYKLYLNYDGQGSRVSGDSIEVESSNSELVSVFAYNDTEKKTLFVVFINKVESGPVPVTLDISAIANSGTIEFFGFTKTNILQPMANGDISNGQMKYSAPAWSATLGVVNYT